jgi:hypothetical protein
MPEEQKKSGFWSTTPGILTAIAAIIGALSGLIGVLLPAGIFKEAPNAPSQPPQEVQRQSASLRKIILGNYTVQGRNPNGSSYSGEAAISFDGSKYEIGWNLAGGQRFYGSGILDDKLLKINWEGGMVTYIIRDNGKILDGTWANGKGSEILTLVSELR